MASGVVTECHGIRIEPQGHQTGKIRRIPSGLEYIIKQFIIPVKQSQNFSSICTPLLEFGVVMPVATIITAEFLVCTPILYPIPALQACRRNSDSLLCVTHPSRFFPKDEYINPSSQEEGTEIYVFGRRIFCFLT